MTARCLPRLALALLALVAVAVLGPVAAQDQPPACTTLACPKCTAVCKAYCEAEAALCRKRGERYCPRAYRSCSNGCTVELCAQCMPVQFAEGGKRFLPGRTELCRTPGAPEKN